VKLITRDTDYAFRVLCFIVKRKGKIVSAEDLVRHLMIPRPFLRKILQILNKKNILRSYKGQGGGFTLLRGADRLYLVDLIEIFQGVFCLNECLFKKAICPNIKTCVLRKKITEIERYVAQELRTITVASVLKNER
jgi:Rrf2 family transcriptional regulator, cysteine metabolism repressor